MDIVAVIFWLIVLALIVLYGVAWWKVFAKAGYHGALGLLMYIPLVNFIMLLILGFKQWPVGQEQETAAT